MCFLLEQHRVQPQESSIVYCLVWESHPEQCIGGKNIGLFYLIVVCEKSLIRLF